jgi:outer membrane protein OmpA-like peptidoglycan-associated protein
VSLALNAPGAQLLVDSSRFQGMIVDVLTVQPEFLRTHGDEVQAVVQTYLEVLHDAAAAPGGMEKLIREDADKIHEPKIAAHAASVVRGIWWKNTVENYAHFRLLQRADARGLAGVGQMVDDILKVLNATREPDEAERVLGRPDKVYDDRLVRRLFERKPKPLYLGEEQVRAPAAAVPIGDAQWRSLRPVGQVKVDPVPFTRRNNLDVGADEVLDRLAADLKRLPQYYLRIEGHTLYDGDPADNARLGLDRAEKVKAYLVEQGVPAFRLQGLGRVPDQPPGRREVRFVFLEAP